MEKKDIIQTLLSALPTEPRSYDVNDDPGFWTDGDMILCPSKVECEIIATFLEDVLREFNGNISVVTGYFDPYEDAGNGETDDYTGFYYISFE